MGFLISYHLQHKIFLAETKKIQISFNLFFLFQQHKILRKKVAKQRNLAWGHAETFIGDCNIFGFLMPSHKNCFRVPLALLVRKNYRCINFCSLLSV